MIGLTPKLRECLDYIVDYRARFGISPTYRRIGDTLGLKSTSGVSRLIAELESRGYVRRTGRQARSLELLQQDDCPHCGNRMGSAACREAAARKITYSKTPAAHQVTA